MSGAKPHLTPVVRVDSLGRAITRHVKPVATSATAGTLPAPPNPPRPDGQRLGRIAAIVEAVHSTTEELRGSARVNLITSRTVDIAEHLAASPEFGTSEGRRALRAVLGMSRSEETGRMLRGMSVLEGCIGPEHLMRTVAGLKKTPLFEPYWDALNAAPPVVQAAARAAVTALARTFADPHSTEDVKLVSIPGSSTKGYILPRNATATADLVLAQPDRADEVLALANEGATALQIAAIWEGTPRAVSEGFL